MSARKAKAEPAQTELEGMPDPEPPKTYWYDVVDVGLDIFTAAIAAIRATSFVPGLPDNLSPERLREFEDDLSRVYMVEVGRQRWEESMATASDLVLKLYDAARESGKARDWKLEREKVQP